MPNRLDGPRQPWERAVDANCERYGLSERQREIVWLLLSGQSVEEVAETLGRHRGTIKDHLVRIYARLGVRDRLEMTVRLLGVR